MSAPGFVTIGGTFDTNSTETGFLLIAQLVGASTAQSFYLDDVLITDVGGGAVPEPGSFLLALTALAPITIAGWLRRRFCLDNRGPLVVHVRRGLNETPGRQATSIRRLFRATTPSIGHLLQLVERHLNLLCRLELLHRVICLAP